MVCLVYEWGKTEEGILKKKKRTLDKSPIPLMMLHMFPTGWWHFPERPTLLSGSLSAGKGMSGFC